MKNIIPIYRDMETEETYDKELNAYLQYKLVCTPDPKRSSPFSDKVYSLIIIKTAPLDEIETGFFYDIARNAEKALRILDAMLENTVTPCGATDVLENMI